MIEYLNKSQTIGIAIADYENIDFLTTALVLILLAKKQNKQTFFKLNNNLPINPNLETSPQIVLNVRKPVSDVFYEKTENSIKLFLTPESKNISLDDLLCEIINPKENIKCDLVIAIGFKTLKELESSSFDINKTTIINIANSHLNRRFGKVNLIENGASVSKVLFNNIEDIVDKNIATLLLMGVKEGEIGTIQKLIEKGGERNNEKKMQDLTSVLNKMEFNQNTYISEVSNLDEASIPFILKIIKDYFSIKNLVLIFNQNSSIFYAEDEEILNKIKTHFNAQVKNKGGMFKKENLTKEELLNVLK